MFASFVMIPDGGTLIVELQCAGDDVGAAGQRVGGELKFEQIIQAHRADQEFCSAADV